MRIGVVGVLVFDRFVDMRMRMGLLPIPAGVVLMLMVRIVNMRMVMRQ